MVTPRRMAEVLAMSSGMREGMGLTTALLALIVLVGAIVRRRAMLATAGIGALAVVGVVWSIFAITYHWGPFIYFYATLTALSAAIFFLRAKAG